MFGLQKNSENDFALVMAERESFLSILVSLIKLLNNSGHNAQSDFVCKLIEQIEGNNFTQFASLINGAAMWGGAGAVWEVYIENKDEADEFEKEIVKLISLMEKTEIIRKGIKPIK